MKPTGVFFIVVFFGLTLVTPVFLPALAGAEGKSAPPLKAALLDGTSFELAQAAGDVVIVHFWATWCKPCRVEMPAIEEYYRKHRAEGLRVLAISMDEPDDEAKVREAMRAFSFQGALAESADFKEYGRIWRLPLTFVIDRKGVLRKDGWYGRPSLELKDLEKTVTPLLR